MVRCRLGSTSLVAVLALCAGAAGCIEPASEVMVVVGTDIDPSIPLTITATVSRDPDGGSLAMTRSWQRQSRDGGVDGGISLPASFAIEPSVSSPADPLTLVVVGNAGGVVIRRRAQFTVSAHHTTVLRIFLSSRCVQSATGCRAANPCTVQAQCEEQGETCGNEGSCVEVPVAPGTDLDGSFGDVPPPSMCGLYHQACCAVGSPCTSPLSCVSGRCQRCTDPGEVCCNGGDYLADGTHCGSAPDACHAAPACRSGTCEPPAALPDGTACGSAPDVCHTAPTCSGGVCGAPPNVPDGTPCGSAPDNCHGAPTCSGGVCGAPPNVADGTICAAASGPCQNPGRCTSGHCGGVTNVANGTVCASTSNPCKRPGTCSNGTCGAIANAPNGTQCSTPSNPCHTPATCTSGTCGSEGTRADGYQWGSGINQRCCGGAAVTTDTNTNCGVCNLHCTTGTCTAYNGRYYCPCTANSQCFSSCCRTSTPGNNLCVPGVCSTGACAADCPGGATCFDASGSPNYCYYP